MRSIQNPARPKPREVTHTTVMRSEAKHLKSRPTKTPRRHPTSCLSAPAALQPGARGWFANRPCCAFAQNDRVGRMLVSLLCASCWSRQAYKLRTHVIYQWGAILNPAMLPTKVSIQRVGDSTAVAHSGFSGERTRFDASAITDAHLYARSSSRSIFFSISHCLGVAHIPLWYPNRRFSSLPSQVVGGLTSHTWRSFWVKQAVGQVVFHPA